jgi:hypothetical protein
MVHKAFWTGLVTDKLRMNSARNFPRFDLFMFTDNRNKVERAIETILRDGRVEQTTKTPQKFGIWVFE